MSRREPRDLPLENIQGPILDSYFDKHVGFFLLFRIKDAELTRRWLHDNSELITSARDAIESREASERPAQEAFYNIAFSYSGLEALDVDPGLINAFPPAFVEDSDTACRAQILGDVGTSEPSNWNWGSRDNGTQVHVILLAYFNNARWREEIEPNPEGFARRAEEEYGMELVAFLDTQLLNDNKEHFGFRDLIGQPQVGRIDDEYSGNTVAPGEFVLGYENGFGKGRTASVPSFLPTGEESDRLELGRNGSYLVFRQLEQDVLGFWKYCCDHAEGGEVQEVPYPPVTVASKMVGRWPGGHPLVGNWDPDGDSSDPDMKPDGPITGIFDRLAQAYRRLLGKLHDDMNDFDYSDDPRGEQCPFGSHIRRSNPRNWELGITPEESLRLANLHRILRRGRTYGPPMMGEEMDTYSFPDKVKEISSISEQAIEAVRRKLVEEFGHDDIEKLLLREINKNAELERIEDKLELDDEERRIFRLFFLKRGVHFLCFNADIERQFEFVQQQWCNNSKFAGLDSDADPLMGHHEGTGKYGINPPTFTIPAAPLRHRCTGMKRFAIVKGSGYFFMPSISDVVRLGRGDFHRRQSPEEPGYDIPDFSVSGDSEDE